MEEYFQLLQYEGINISNIDNVIENWNNDKKKKFASDIYEVIKHRPFTDLSSNYNFISNSQLSGETFCDALECRLRKIDSIARFAALYADCVLINNPFDKYMLIDEFDIFSTIKLIDDIKIMYYLRPLLDAGVMKVTTNVHHFCTSCYKKVISNEKIFIDKLNLARNTLLNRCANEVKYTYVLENDIVPKVLIEGPEELIDHSVHYLYVNGKILEAFSKSFNIGKPHSFSYEELIDMELYDYIVNPIVDDMLNQNFYSNTYNAHYITDRSIDFDVLNAVNSNDTNVRSKMMMEGLSHSVPCLRNVDLGDLIELREKEGESFLVYRDTIKNISKSINTLEPNEFKEAFCDLIQPEIHNINNAINNSRILLKKSIGKNIIDGTGRVIIGLFSGILPVAIGKIVAGLGGLSGVNIIKDSLRLLDEPQEIRNNKLYFLWKVERLKK